MSNDISIVTSTMPAHLKKGTNLGNENISSEHLSTPRLKQLQQLSNEVDENHSEYIDGAKVGELDFHALLVCQGVILNVTAGFDFDGCRLLKRLAGKECKQQ